MPNNLKYIAGLIFSVIFYFPTLAQQSLPAARPLFFEKTYLHTDRDVYLPGDDIWFKAYLLNAQTNRAVGYSNNLHVELINSRSQIVSRVLVRMDNGLGKGDFKLRDTVSPGTYRIRAYTNWMRNFGDNFIFEKDVRILPITSPASLTAAKTHSKAPEQSATGITNTAELPFSITFLPEGGNLVSGVISLVGVKAEDGWGRGVPATGEVLNPEGESVARFTCDSLGMGAFTLWPGSGIYKATVLINGKKEVFQLPAVQTSGFVMSARMAGPQINIALSCTDFTLSQVKGKLLRITASHRGRIYFHDSITVTATGSLIQIPPNLLPSGVACLTLSDDHNTPISERLVYVPADNRAKVAVTANKPAYLPKEKTTLNLKLTDVGRASLSLAVVDAGVVPVMEEDIVSYLSLRSEIKGRIEHPRRYFDTTNVNRLKQLDLLLLTQGWRGFIWKKIADSILNLAYKPEQGIDITGKVRKVWGKAPMPGLNITLFAPGATGQKLFSTSTDSAGRFRINGALFYGYQYLNFNSRSSKGIKSDGTSKGFSGGWLQVDSLKMDTLSTATMQIIDERVVSAYIQEIINQETARQKFSFSGVNELKEVIIKGGRSNLPAEIHQVTLTEQREFDNLAQYLLYMIEGSSLEVSSCGCFLADSAIRSSMPILKTGRSTVLISAAYADRSKLESCICYDQYLALSMKNVLKVTINRSLGALGKRISVQILLRPGVLTAKDNFDNTMADMVGYYKSRVFYSPKFEGPNQKLDERGNTIHWEPDIVTDDKGEATVSFYNKEQKGKVRLVLQGVTDKGEPISATSTYEVK